MRYGIRVRFALACALAIASWVALTQTGRGADEPKRIDVSAKRFEFNPAEITIKKDEPVVLVFHSEDVTHGIRFKELGLETEISKGDRSELRVTPDKAGDFVGHCSHFCGEGHGLMTLTLHVIE